MNNVLENKTILLFDGYCNLCQSSVQFVLKHEKKQVLVFTSLQSPIGKKILNQYSINPNEIDSLVLIKNNKAYIKSSAALRLGYYLKGIYFLGVILIIIPPMIRNFVYDYIAKNRYKWFGKSEACMIPDEKIANRFL